MWSRCPNSFFSLRPCKTRSSKILWFPRKESFSPLTAISLHFRALLFLPYRSFSALGKTQFFFALIFESFLCIPGNSQTAISMLLYLNLYQIRQPWVWRCRRISRVAILALHLLLRVTHSTLQISCDTFSRPRFAWRIPNYTLCVTRLWLQTSSDAFWSQISTY